MQIDQDILDALLAQAPTPIWITDPNRILFINQAAIRLLHGRGPEDFLGRSSLDFIDAKYHAVVRERIESIHHGDIQSSPLEEEFVALTGERIPVLASGVPVLLDSQRAQQVHFVDLRPLRRAERKSDADRAQLELVTDKMPALVAYLDTDLRYLSANRSYLAWTGYQPGQLIGKCVSEVISHHVDAADCDRAYNSLRRCLKGESVSATLHGRYASEARIVEAHYSPDCDPDGTIRGVIALLMDVTEQHRAQDELHFRATLLEEALEPIFAWKMPGSITYWNRAAEELYGFSRHEALGKCSHALLDTVAGVSMARLEATLQARGLWQGQLNHRKKSGERVLVDSRMRTVTVNGHLFAIECTRDITQRQEAERKLRDAAVLLEARVAERTEALTRANDDLEAYAYSISHDLRAPLRTMQGFSDAILDDYAGQLEHTARHYLERIRASAQRMDDLINDLLEYSRIGRANIVLERVDLNAVVRDVLTQQQASIDKSGAVIRVNASLPRVTAHYTTLMQIVSNLLANALKFNAPGSPPDIHIGAGRRDQFVRFWILDHGIGINPEHQERIFRVFERLHGQETYPGTGVGLAIVKRAAERLGGRVGVSSNPQEGTCFWVELPASEGS